MCRYGNREGSPVIRDGLRLSVCLSWFCERSTPSRGEALSRHGRSFKLSASLKKQTEALQREAGITHSCPDVRVGQSSTLGQPRPDEEPSRCKSGCGAITRARAQFWQRIASRRVGLEQAHRQWRKRPAQGDAWGAVSSAQPSEGLQHPIPARVCSERLQHPDQLQTRGQIGRGRQRGTETGNHTPEYEGGM